MVNLYILCGLPFSGKSLLGKEMSIKTGYSLISYDDVWQSLFHLHQDITYDVVLNVCKKQIYDLLHDGFTVIYDSANLKEEQRQYIKRIADDMGLNTAIVYIEISLKEVKERRKQSLLDKTHHIVSNENFTKAIEQLEKPDDAFILRNQEDKDRFLNTIN